MLGDSERHSPSPCPSWVEGTHGACSQAPSVLVRALGSMQLLGGMVMGGGLASGWWVLGCSRSSQITTIHTDPSGQLAVVRGVGGVGRELGNAHGLLAGCRMWKGEVAPRQSWPGRAQASGVCQ